MSQEPDLVTRLRAAWPDAVEHHEVRMFGGIAFLHQGNMVAADSSRGLLMRVGPANEAEILTLPGTSVLEMRGKPVPGYIRIVTESATAPLVATILPVALAFVKTLPPKDKTAQSKRAKPRSRA